ncbi:MAG: hypothetical protein WD602_05255 [Actinomycetota bacterium]
MRKIVTALCALMLIAAGCNRGGGVAERGDLPIVSPGTTASPSGPALSGECSAAPASRNRPQQTDLPKPVLTMREQILEAAIDCDYERLTTLALEPDGAFQYSLTQESAGPDAQPAEFWRSQEEAGDRPLVALVEILTSEPEIQPVTDPEGPGTGSGEEYYNWPSDEEPHPRGYQTSITSSGDWILFLQQ